MLEKKLKMLRERSGLSQKEAADRIGIARTTLIRYERISSRIPISIFIQIAEVYDLNQDDLEELEQAMKEDMN